MSRRPPNPAAERAAQNQQTIKSLLKLEANKVCADCKRNKHPRWASWNLGIFICIRCSGIHRGMGTHISRVKSVDLDAWTDEQLQSVLSWGNARANKYWEAKLAAGHVPSESKIENFIRTKYELKRWVMDGPIPDPKTLDVEGDDDIPLSIVKEKQTIDRQESIRKSSVGRSAAPAKIAAPQDDLIGGDPIPQRASTAGPTATKVPPKAEPAPPRASSTKDSLLGLDFLGTEPAAPPRPASTTGTSSMSGGQSRPDLKQSILSLYASAPRPQPQPQPAAHASSGSFGGSGSFAGMPSPTMSQPQNTGGGFVDAFSNLSFNSSQAPKSPQNDAFSSFGNLAAKPSPPPPQNTASTFSGLSGGSFFDTKPTMSAPSHQQKQSLSGFGGFASPTMSAPAPKPAAAPSSSAAALSDLFDFSSPAPPAAQPTSPPAQQQPPPSAHSVFNLSASQPKPAPTAPTATPASNPMGALSSNLSGADVWGGNAWGAPDPPAAPAPSAASKNPGLPKTSSLGMTNDFGWGGGSGGSLANQSIVPGAGGGFNPTPKVAADEEFGGWTSSGGSGPGNAKPASGVTPNEDLFSNVWQ